MLKFAGEVGGSQAPEPRQRVRPDALILATCRIDPMNNGTKTRQRNDFLFRRFAATPHDRPRRSMQQIRRKVLSDKCRH